MILPIKYTPEEARAAWKAIEVQMDGAAWQGALQVFMEWRGIRGHEAVCKGCNGTGKTMYGSTATWHGGMGGAAMTMDVCDTCWGSGSNSNPGTDLRKLSNEQYRMEVELRQLRKFKEKHEQL